VIFGKKYQRTFAICCADRDLVLAQLVTVRDMWCGGFSPSPEGVSRGLAVPPKLIGELTIGTTTSAISGKRALTLEQGEGYVAFQCDAWLPTLIDRLEASRCCVK
jgi:hypothetical protein